MLSAAPASPPTFRADYDYDKIYAGMMKPAFLFDGRLLLDHAKLKAIGFDVCCCSAAADSRVRQVSVIGKAL